LLLLLLHLLSRLSVVLVVLVPPGNHRQEGRPQCQGQLQQQQVDLVPQQEEQQLGVVVMDLAL
jgi:hypothetical protein